MSLCRYCPELAVERAEIRPWPTFRAQGVPETLYVCAEHAAKHRQVCAAVGVPHGLEPLAEEATP